jgi:hypothetical protein
VYSSARPQAPPPPPPPPLLLLPLIPLVVAAVVKSTTQIIACEKYDVTTVHEAVDYHFKTRYFSIQSKLRRCASPWAFAFTIEMQVRHFLLRASSCFCRKAA